MLHWLMYIMLGCKIKTNQSDIDESVKGLRISEQLIWYKT